MISGWSQLMWARSHVMWVEGTRLVAVNVSRNRRCSQAELFMISSRYTYGSTTATCPVRTYQSWLEKSAIRTGPVFRGIDRFGRLQDKRLHPASVARILKRAVERAGFDETLFAGHSLRAGFVTQAYLNDASEFDIMRQTRHKSLTTMRRYIRDYTLFRKNAAAKLGL